jgi:hypothetical protein
LAIFGHDQLKPQFIDDAMDGEKFDWVAGELLELWGKVQPLQRSIGADPKAP